VQEFARQTIGPRAGCPSLRSVVGAKFVDLGEFMDIGLPSSAGLRRLSTPRQGWTPAWVKTRRGFSFADSPARRETPSQPFNSAG
jgi:hypothetical protein